MQCYQQYEEAGTDLAQALSKKETIAKLKSMPVPISKALGKLSSGLYVVTAGRADASSAMIASWVAQASFEPLGLTIAIAKDRAIESLMQVRIAAAPHPSAPSSPRAGTHRACYRRPGPRVSTLLALPPLPV